MANSRSLVVFYVLFFMFVGVTLPFLPIYYASLHIPASQIGLLLSVGPVFALVSPPIWGQLADRSGRPGLVLLALSCGSLVGVAALLVASTFEAVLLALVVFSVFNSATTTVADSLALAHVELHGGSFPRIRSFGSLGFVVATLAFGFLVERVDRRVVIVSVALVSLYALWTGLTLARTPARKRQGPRPTIAAALELVKNPQVRWLLVASAAHWVASAPYHGALGLHFSSLKFAPSTVSLSASIAVASEVLVFATWPRWAHLVRPRVLLLIAFGASALRWTAMGTTSSQPVLISLAALHGLSFGVFYVASIAWVADRSPASMRATGQALFVAATFGIGGLVGFTTTGRLYEVIGGHHLFLAAGAAELIPALVAAWLLKDDEGAQPSRA